MSYLTQMSALAVQNFVCAASGMAVLVALIRGIARKTTSTHRQLLGRPRRGARSTSCLPLSIVLALVFVSQGVVQTFSRRSARRAAPGDEGRRRARPSTEQVLARRARSRRRRRSSSSGRTAAASSTPTPRTRSRTRRRSRNFLEMLRAPRDPGGAHLHVRQDGQGHAPGLGDPRGDVRRLPAAPLAVRRRGAGGQPRARVAPRRPGRERAPVGRQHGGQGGALRHLGVRALRDGDDRRLVRRGQRDARLVHAARRASSRCCSSSSARSSSAASAPGMYGMLMFAIVAVFVAGLMVGRTPEYIGKKIEATR